MKTPIHGTYTLGTIPGGARTAFTPADPSFQGWGQVQPPASASGDEADEPPAGKAKPRPKRSRKRD